jgi:hypothetical protein
MSPLLTDAGILSAAAAVVTVMYVVTVRLIWRRGKELEEP